MFGKKFALILGGKINFYRIKDTRFTPNCTEGPVLVLSFAGMVISLALEALPHIIICLSTDSSSEGLFLQLFMPHLCYWSYHFIDSPENGLKFLPQNIELLQLKKGPTRHRHMAHPIGFRYLSYSTTLGEHAIHCLRECPAFGRAGTCLFSSVQ